MRKPNYYSILARLFLRIYENGYYVAPAPNACDRDARLRVWNQYWISFGRGCVLPQDRLEASSPTPVEVRCSLRVLAEQGRFGR